MSKEEHAPLRFWIGLHKDGSGRQCIVDFDGGPMEGVKAAWNAKNAQAVTTMETVIQPELSRSGRNYLELLVMMERRLGDPRLTCLAEFLREVVMTAYEAGMQDGGRTPKRP